MEKLANLKIFIFRWQLEKIFLSLTVVFEK